MKTTIVIPTYNEAENLPKLVPQLMGLPLGVSLLIVDDGSPDGTGQMAEAFRKDYPGRIDVLHREFIPTYDLPAQSSVLAGERDHRSDLDRVGEFHRRRSGLVGRRRGGSRVSIFARRRKETGE